MRRLYLSLVGLSWLGLAGCHSVCSHGVCDCQQDIDDHCCTRAPWVRFHGAPPPPATLGGPVAPVEVIPPGPPMPSAPMPSAPLPSPDAAPQKF